MRTGSCATIIVLLFVACERVQQVLPGGPAAVRQTRATVVTIRTTVQPGNRTTTHAVVIGESAARSTEEVANWRLFDFRRNRVTYVDDVGRTYRVVPLSTLVQDRRAHNSREAIPAHPRAEYTLTDERQSILGVQARQATIRLGNYERQLWFATHPRIPANLFALMLVSERRASSFGQVTRTIDEGLLAVRGFPIMDHAELPYGKEMMVVDRNVVRIEQRNVPAALLEIPRTYREIKEPVVSPPPASSPPPDQKTPEAESPPSSTTQTVP